MRVPRPSASMIVASAALLVALGGTGYAAVKLPKNSVGTKQLKANSVTGAKVKNRSLKAEDFAPGQVPAGATGATGATGPQGERGPSDAFAAGTDVGIDLPNSAPSTPTASLTLGAGSYVIVATVGTVLTGGSQAIVQCDLAGGGATQNQQAEMTLGGERQNIAMTAVSTFTQSTTVTLSCRDRVASSTGDASTNGAHLVAVKVATVTGSIS